MTSSVSSSGKKADPLYRKFKKENSEGSQSYETNEFDEPRKKENFTKPEANNIHSMDYSSSSSRNLRQLVKKTVLQEKIFNWQMQAEDRKKMHESSSGSDSLTNSLDDRHRSFLNSSSHHDHRNNERVNMNGILHLKKPMVVNSNDHDTFYEERGQMHPIPWRNFSSKSNSQEKPIDKKKEPEIPNKTIRNIAKSKPLISEEFSNFLGSSVASRSAYDIQGNTEKDINYIDCPVYRIQQLTKKKNLNTKRIPASVRPSFLARSSGNHLFNRIDTFSGALEQRKNANSRSLKTERLDQKAGSYNRNHLAESRSSEIGKLEQQPELYCHSKIAQNSSSGFNNQLEENVKLLNNVMPAGDRKSVQKEKDNEEVERGKETPGDDVVTFVNSLSSEENVAKKKAARKALEIEDDQFVFVQNSPKLSSEISTVPPFASKISPHRYPFDRLKAVCKETKQTIKPLIKADSLKHMTRIQFKTVPKSANETLDSDDTFNISSNLGSSVSVTSTRERFRGYKKKMLDSTLSNKHENSIILPDEDDDNKVLENKNQLLNRCLRATYDYSKMHDDNVVEITNVKIGPKPEPLLRAISTRYFAKSSTDSHKPTNNGNNNKIEKIEYMKDNNEIENIEHKTFCISEDSIINVMSSTLLNNLQEEKCVDFNIKSNASIDNISSISPMSIEQVNAKTDDKNNVNEQISLALDQKVELFDSASLTENIETSLVIPSTNKNKVNMELKNLEILDVSKNKGLIEINKNLKKTSESPKSITQSENQHSKITSNTTKNTDSKSELKTKKCKIETVHSDYKNELIDCKVDMNYEFDIENFEIENMDAWISRMKVKANNNNKISDVSTNYNEIAVDDCSNDICSSLSNGSSSDRSVSPNENSETSSSPRSLFDFSSVFEKVDIKLSELKTNGLDYVSLPKGIEHDNKKVVNNLDQKVSNKNENHQLDYHSMQSKIISISQGKLCNQQDKQKENTEQNLNNICDLVSQNSEKPKISHDNVATTPKVLSKKMQKYKSTLSKYKDKSKAEVDKKEDTNFQQLDNSSMSLQRRQILKEIQKHKLHLSVRQIV